MNPTLPTAARHIPVITQTENHPPKNEDEELDQIMRDVGHQMSKEELPPVKQHRFSLKRQPKKEVPFTAQPVHVKPPEPAPVHHVAPKPQPAVQPEPISAAVVKPAPIVKPKPKTGRQVPVFVIFVTFLVTGFLVSAAIAAYRQ